MSLSDGILLVFPEYRNEGLRLAAAAGIPAAEAEIHHFPDGESRVRLPPELPEHVVVCRSLDDPNNKLVELMLAAGAARTAGARRLTLVAPYLCYMRQDKAFNPGEAVSQQIVGAQLASWFDEVVTVDPHLHRVERLADAVPAARTVAVSAATAIAQFLADRSERPVIVGPDAESEQWVAKVAGLCGLEHRVAHKQRLGDRSVRLELPAGDLAGRSVVIIDDVVSTGHTLLAALSAVRARGARRAAILVTHPLFADDVMDSLRAAGADDVWSTDSIPHPTNTIELAGLLATALSSPTPTGA